MRAVVRKGFLGVEVTGLLEGLEVQLVQADGEEMSPAERVVLDRELEAALEEAKDPSQLVRLEELWT